MDLPPELHLHISKYLIYPDALSLKHVNRYFFALVHTGITLKVEWLMQRRSLHLECPNTGRCDLGSDVRFCRGSVAFVSLSIPLIFLFPLIPSGVAAIGERSKSKANNRLCRLLMKRRREHIECESRPDLGCLIYGTKVCVHRRSVAQRWARRLRTILTAELWWLLVAAIPLLCCGAWILEMLGTDQGNQESTTPTQLAT
ncbi:unnamed protein product [Parascedosporium putredinis]|uniref:F-box domain-containing protein n=1 Tax=Parascedosporium putredinis TaxID=1442378 RepID=A0A9P1H3F1_9PEZI|nr:unnamed protein product [Parascedosporium putredinis]CAI7995096.1 unnamed protein product [Parascedosporium putredinis]